MAAAPDGATSGSFTGASSGTLTLTTTNANDLIVVAVYNESGGATGPFTISSIAGTSGTGTVGTFQKFTGASITQTGVGAFGTSHDDMEVWWAVASTVLTSKVLTVTLSGTTDDVSMQAFGISGANTTTPLDPSGVFTTAVTLSGGNISSVAINLTTSNPSDMLLLFAGNAGQSTSAATAGTFGANSATLLTPIVKNGGGAFESDLWGQYFIASSTQSAVSSKFGSTTMGNNAPTLLIALGIQSAGAAASLTLGGSAPMFAPLLGPKFSEFKPQLAFPATSISAVLAVTEASDVAAFNGFVGVSGTLATTDTTDTAAFNGDVVVSGTLAVTENTDTAAFNGSVVVSGTLAVTDTPDTAAFIGDVVVSGTLVVTDGTDTAVFNGTVGNVVSGTLAATDIPDTAAFAGSVVVSGSLAVTETPDVAVFAGDVVISATLSTTDTPDVASFSGVVASTITATFAVTEPTDIVFFTDAQLSFGGFTPDRWRRKEHQYNAYRERTSVIAEAAAHMSSLGGHARAASLSSKERSSIASTAAKARWNNQQA